MKVLFVHQNFPGQYLHLAQVLARDPANEVVFLTQRKEMPPMKGVRKIVYQPSRKVTPNIHHYLRDHEAGILNAQAVVRAAMDLKRSGFVPDVMLGHNGWGEIWYLKDVFPASPLIGYFEFFYQAIGADAGFDPSDPPTADTFPRIRTKNIGNLLGLDAADFGQTPTRWQHSTYPELYQPRIKILHEGIDTSLAKPNPEAVFEVPVMSAATPAIPKQSLREGEESKGSESVSVNEPASLSGGNPSAGLRLKAGDEVLTYVARNLEPYRGFPSFMRSLPKILEARPEAQVLIVGGDDISYGGRLPEGSSYKQRMLKELEGALDLSRIHFLGKLPYLQYLKVLQVSRVHVYLTYPFVLSWSALEAMATGCLLVASKTQPVEEVITNNENGLLVDFFKPEEIAEKVIEALKNPQDYTNIRNRARQTAIERFDLETKCLPEQMDFVAEVAGKKFSNTGKTLH